MQKLLTIVVPVYKVEPYINKCLDSCLIYKINEQGEKVLDEEMMSQLEVIIVNDGTPDRSAEMSHEYVKRYPQTFRQIDKENGGHGSAWNIGLREASGKYIRFLDSDDWLDNLDKLMRSLSATEADVVFSHSNRYFAEKDRNEEERIQEEYGTEKMLKDFPFSENRQYTVMNFLFATYKKDILLYGKDVFSEKTMYDDAVLFVLPAIKGKSYISLDFVVYNYFIGRVGQSVAQEARPENIIARSKQAVYMDEFWTTNKPVDIDARIEEGMVYYIHNNAWHVFENVHLLPYTQASEIEKKMRHILRYMATNSKNYKRYTRLPFWMYYSLNRFRHLMGKI